MVERQIRRRGIGDPRILAAFGEVPRERFVPEDMAEFAYDDGPLPIGEGQTISQPYIVAAMIDAAEVSPGGRVLEVGAGSGYAAAVLSRIAARVFAIERHAILARHARERIEALGYDNCTVIAGDGMEGLPGEAPFDAILVAARGIEVPRALERQLAVGGRLIIPITGGAEAQIAGKATYFVNDVGAGNYSFIARVIDKGTPGTNDQFGMKLINPSGQVVFNFNPVTLGGGNNQVPKK